MSALHLALAHHFLAFGLVAILAYELALVRIGLSGADIARVARIDAAYGLFAMLIVAVGIGRVYWGGKGPDYYFANPWFWAKMGAFVLVGLLSILPTMRFFRWRKALRTTDALPAPAEIKSVRGVLMAEAVCLASVPLFAAAMARWTG